MIEKIKSWFGNFKRKPALVGVLIGAVFAVIYFAYSKLFKSSSSSEESDTRTVMYTMGDGGGIGGGGGGTDTGSATSLVESQTDIMENYMTQQNEAMSDFMAGMSEVLVGMADNDSALAEAIAALKVSYADNQTVPSVDNLQNSGGTINGISQVWTQQDNPNIQANTATGGIGNKTAEGTKTVFYASGPQIVAADTKVAPGIAENDSDGRAIYIGDTRTNEQKDKATPEGGGQKMKYTLSNGATWQPGAGGYVLNGKVVSTTPQYD